MNVLISIIGLVILKNITLWQHLKCIMQIKLTELNKKYNAKKFSWILLLVI
jgi:hypothetical protein